MKRSRIVWIGFSLSTAVTTAAMGWVTLAVVRLDRAEAGARRQASREEKVRLALWRADSTVAPLVTQESLLPWFAYRSFFPVERPFSNLADPRGKREMLVPSPLLTTTTPHVLVHFQFERDGLPVSPETPSAENRRLAIPRHTTAERVGKAEKELARVAAITNRQQLGALLPEHPAAPVQVVLFPGMVSNNGQALPPQSPLAQSPRQRLAERNRRVERQSNQQQALAEYDVRKDLFLNQTTVAPDPGQVNIAANQPVSGIQGGTLPSTDLSGVPMTPLWIGGELLLARRISAAGNEYVQGCLLDWPSIRDSLLDTVGDLLPAASFEPVPRGDVVDPSRMLAALPVRLVPGELPDDGGTAVSPLVLSLAVAWACVLVAAAAVAGLLAGVIRLSERRASFVSAVTHELRTPLTTFQMYVEMLAEGMVPEGDRQQYLKTLRAEAMRLTHMVENVLSYARLERGRAEGRVESVSLGRLVDRVQGRLIQRAEQAGMEVVVEGAPSERDCLVEANVSAVEQILFNLVDNACKYAADAADKRIHVELCSLPVKAELSVRDHGPGLAPAGRRRWFRSFSKSAQEAAQTAPGIGLGLALSRRLARHMGGALRLDSDMSGGARFVLTLAYSAEPRRANRSRN